MQRKSKTNGPSVGPSPGKWAPTFLKSSVWDLGWGGCQPETLSWKSMCPFKCWRRDKNPNRTETHSCTYCMWGKFKNRNAWEPGNRDCKSCTPPKCESSGCPKAFSAFALLNLQYIFWLFLFVVHSFFCLCIFVHLWFPFFIAFSFRSCFLFAFLRSICLLHVSRFQFSKISPQGADTRLAYSLEPIMISFPEADRRLRDLSWDKLGA